MEENQRLEVPRLEVPLAEKLKGIPGFFGVRISEQPAYLVLFKDHAFEIRQYPPLVLASTHIHSDYTSSKNEAFLRLARYIFGKNHTHKNISMTSPVFHQERKMLSMTSSVIEEKRIDDWSMTFILPRGFSFETAPTPLDNRILLSTKPTEKWAVLRYTGSTDEKLMLNKVNELKTWLAKQGAFRASSEARWAQYDSPVSLPFLRRNEVQIQVTGLQ